MVPARFARVHLVPELNPLPSEAVFDKIAMSAFEGTPLNFALRDCGVDAFFIVGIAMEIGIEPTVRHGADLGYIPVIVKTPVVAATATPLNVRSRPWNLLAMLCSPTLIPSARNCGA